MEQIYATIFVQVQVDMPSGYEKHAVERVQFMVQYIQTCAKNSPAVKKGEAKNAQVHVHGVTTTKRHDIKIWPRKHLQY